MTPVRQSQHQGQCQERLMPPSQQLQQPLGQFNLHVQFDSVPYNPDEASPGTPQMKAVHPKLEPSESPPPDIPRAQVSFSPSPTDGYAKSNRPKIRPVSGDTVLVTYLGNGSYSEVAQVAGHQALPGGDENFDLSDEEPPQKSPLGDDDSLAAADVYQRPSTAQSRGNTLLQSVAADALSLGADLGSYHALDKPSSDLSALSIHDDVSPSPSHHVASPSSILGGRQSTADSRSQSLISRRELPPLQAPSKYDSQSMSLPSIRSTLGDIDHPFPDHTFPTEMPTPGDRDRDVAIRRAGDAPTFSRSPTVVVPRYQSMSAGSRVSSPPMSPSEAYQRSFPSPKSLPASSPYNSLASNGSASQRSPAEYPAANNAPTKTLHPTTYAVPSPTAGASVADRMSIDELTHPQVGAYVCTVVGCTAPPFQTQYLLNSHANVHSSARPHYCPVKGCPRSEGGKGFKRKNEMIRHGLVHDSPGYVCPFCADREHKYPRPDNLQRYVLCFFIFFLFCFAQRYLFSQLLHIRARSEHGGLRALLPPFQPPPGSGSGLAH